MIIGISGNYAAGKDTFAEFFVKKNFEHFSLSDMIRKELKKEKRECSRENMILKGNQLRMENGSNILAKLALETVKDGENYVFSSIRNPEEVRLFNQRDDFILVNILAPVKERFKRIQLRGRDGDPQSLKELKEKEARENNVKNKNSQQLDAVAKMAKINVNNNKTILDLEKKADLFLNDWLFKLQDDRPKWSDYFMQIADVVKLRATCMSAKKGTVIVKNKRIIATGYNGTPKGIKHCTAGSCIRCTARHKGELNSGDYSKPCICAHSEENAIVQAAFQGTSTNGASLYTTFTPCTNCAKLIINAGIKEVFAKTVYPDDVGTQLLKEAGVKLRVI